MNEPTYAILGMGRFNRKLTTMLAATGSEILIADQKKEVINRYAEYATHAVCVDLSNANALQEIGLEHIDIAVIDISHHMEPSILSIMVARELGVKRIIATASTRRFGEVLKKIGADEIIIPEDDAAVRLAKRLISEDFMEFYDLGGNLCVIKTHPKDKWVGKSLKSLRLRERERMNIVAIEKNGAMSMDFSPDTVLEKDSVIALAMKKQYLYDFV